MGNIYRNNVEQRRIERLILGVYTMYGLSMVVRATSYKWEGWISAIFVTGVAVGWILFISKYKSYEFRAKVMAVMLEMSLFLYSGQAKDITGGLPLLIAFIIFLGLYEIVEIVYITCFFSFSIFFYHAMVIDTIPLETVQDVLTIVAQLANVVVVEIVVWIWVKKRNEGDSKIQAVIKELRAAEQSKDDFLANVSHEIRTPINTICGISEIVLREELPFGVKENVLNIQSAGQNLMSVVSDILDFSELESGKMELEEEAYNIAATVNDIITMSLARKMEKKIELIIDCDANIPCALLGDEKKIRRVIMNLVDNAIKFTDEGCVTISIGCRKEDYGINLMVTVKDTGIGIDEESLDKMFTGFHQVDASSKRSEGGLGLGLAISYALIRKMGGIITIKSRQGRGTVVKFVVPQKVLDEAPVAALRSKDEVSVATYIDMEQFNMMEIRDEYSAMILHMVENLRGKCQVCRNFAQLQRREEKEGFSHVFTSIIEYRQNKKYFDELSERTNVVIVLNRTDEKYITNERLLKVYKPFSIISIVATLNGSDNEEQEQVSGATAGFITKDAHVLVVDDNRMNIRVIEGLLGHYKMKVTVADSGREALEKIGTADYDFVFMDHMMPEMDGVETMRRIRHKVGNYFRKVPIIALTANAVAGTREALLAQGFNDFLEKPIERSVLERVLKRNLAPEKIIFCGAAEEPGQGARHDEAVENWKELLQAQGVEVQKGIVYCGGEESYLNILRGYCVDYRESCGELQQLFEGQDWTNYTIMVHGIKSAMGSIGAMKLSECAKKLEAAGKTGNIGYIEKNHAELEEGYRSFFELLGQNEQFCPKQSETENGNQSEGEALQQELVSAQTYEEMGEGVFEQFLAEMEEAMFSLNQDKLSELLGRMENYAYDGKPLADMVQKARRKVEMSDFMSAVDMFMKLKHTP